MGILDMYGFERMRSAANHDCNGDFEQLIINFANEKLQQVSWSLKKYCIYVNYIDSIKLGSTVLIEDLFLP